MQVTLQATPSTSSGLSTANWQEQVKQQLAGLLVGIRSEAAVDGLPQLVGQGAAGGLAVSRRRQLRRRLAGVAGDSIEDTPDMDGSERVGDSISSDAHDSSSRQLAGGVLSLSAAASTARRRS